MNWVVWSGVSKIHEEFIKDLSVADVLITDGAVAWIGIPEKDDDCILKPLQLNDVCSRNSELDKMFDELGGALYE